MKSPGDFSLGVLNGVISGGIGGLLGISKGEGFYDVICNLVYKLVAQEEIKLETLHKYYVDGETAAPVWDAWKVVKGEDWTNDLFKEHEEAGDYTDAASFIAWWVNELGATYEAGGYDTDEDGVVEENESTTRTYRHIRYDYYNDVNWDENTAPLYTYNADFYNGTGWFYQSDNAQYKAYTKWVDTQATARGKTYKSNYSSFDNFLWDRLPELFAGLINSIMDPDAEVDFPKDMTADKIKSIVLAVNNTSTNTYTLNSLKTILYKAVTELWNNTVVPIMNTINVDTRGFSKIRQESPTTGKIIDLFRLDWKTSEDKHIGEYNFTGNGFDAEVNDFLGYIVKQFLPDFTNWVSSEDPTTIAENFRRVVIYVVNQVDSSLLPANYQTADIGEILLAGAKLIIGDYIPQLHQETLDLANTTEKLVYAGLQELAAQILPEFNYTNLPAVGSADYDSWPLNASGDLAYNTIFDIASDFVSYFLSGQAPLCTNIGNPTGVHDYNTHYSYKDATDTALSANRKSVVEVLNLAVNWYMYGPYEGAKALNLSSTEGDTAYAKVEEILKYFLKASDFTTSSSWDKLFSAEEWFSTEYDTTNNQYVGKLWNMILKIDVNELIDLLLWAIDSKAVADWSILDTIYYPLQNGINGLLGQSILPNLNSANTFTNLLDSTNLSNMAGALIEGLYNKIDNLLPLIIGLAGNFLNLTNEQVLELPTVNVDNPAVDATAAFSTNLNVYNNAKGVNRQYTDANGVQHQDELYNLVIKNISTTKAGVTISGWTANQVVAQGSQASFEVSTSGAITSGVFEINVTYNMTDETGSPIWSADKILTTSIYASENYKTLYDRIYTTGFDANNAVDHGGDGQWAEECMNMRLNTFSTVDGLSSPKLFSTAYVYRDNVAGIEKLGKEEKTLLVRLPSYIETNTSGSNLRAWLIYLIDDSRGATFASWHNGIIQEVSVYENGTNVGRAYTGDTYDKNGNTSGTATYYHTPATGTTYEPWDSWGRYVFPDTNNLDGDASTLYVTVTDGSTTAPTVYDENTQIFSVENPAVDRYKGIDLAFYKYKDGLFPRRADYSPLFGATGTEDIDPGLHFITIDFKQDQNTSKWNGPYTMPILVEDEAAKTKLESLYNSYASQNLQAADFSPELPEGAAAFTAYKAALTSALETISTVSTYNSSTGTSNIGELNQAYTEKYEILNKAYEDLQSYKTSENMLVQKEASKADFESYDRLDYEFYTFQRFETAYRALESVYNNENSSQIEIDKAKSLYELQKSRMIEGSTNFSKLDIELARFTNYTLSDYSFETANAYYNAYNRALACKNGGTWENVADYTSATLGAEQQEATSWDYTGGAKQSEVRAAREALMKAENALTQDETKYNVVFRNKADTANVSNFNEQAGTTLVRDLINSANQAEGVTLTGYTFTGWKIGDTTYTLTNAGATTLADLADLASEGTLTFIPQYTTDSYTITYNLNSGTNAPANPASYNVESETITLADPTRNGYTFGGWFTTANFAANSQVTQITTGSTGNVTLYAKWTARTLDVNDQYNFSVVYGSDEFTSSESLALAISDYTIALKAGESLPAGITLDTVNKALAIDGTVTANVGTYVVTVVYTDTITSQQKQADLRIVVTKADRAIPTWAAQSKTFDGTAWSVVAPTLAEADSPAITYSYKNNANNVVSATAPTNAGTYTVTATVAAGTNYNATTATTTLTISKATLSSTGEGAVTIADIASETYAKGTAYAANSKIAVTLPELATNENVTYTVQWQKHTTSEKFASVENAGIYDAIVTIVANSNYNAASLVFENAFTIDKQEYDISGDPVASWVDKTVTFNGAEQSITVASADESIYTIELADNTLTNVGSTTATATVTLVDSDNYVLTNLAAGGEYTATLTVEAVAPNVSISVEAADSLTDPTATATIRIPAALATASALTGTVQFAINGVAAGDPVAITGGTNGIYTATATLDGMAASGARTFTATFTSTNANYTNGNVPELSFAAGAAEMPEVTLTAGSASVAYGSTVTLTTAGGDGTLAYAYSFDPEYFAAVGATNTDELTLKAIKAGADASEVTVTVTDTAGSYLPGTATANVSTTAKAVTVTAAAQDKVYDKSTDATVTYTVNNVETGDTVTATPDVAGGTFADANVGTGIVVTPSATSFTSSNANYTITGIAAGDVTADITAKTVTASYTADGKTYDGSTDVTVTPALAGVIDGDTVTTTQTAAFANANVGADKLVNITSIALDGADKDNYVLAATTATTTATISQASKDIEVAVANNNYVYNTGVANFADAGHADVAITTATDAYLFTTAQADAAQIKFYKAESAVADADALEDSVFTATAITEEGTWYARAFVADTDNVAYTSNTVEVVILPNTTPALTVTGYNANATDTTTLTLAATVGIEGHNGGLTPVIKVAVNDGEFETYNSTTYTVSQNGTYKFKVSNGSDESAVQEFVYNKIDSNKATASVTSTYVSGEWANEATFTVSVDDSFGTNDGRTKKFYYSVNNGDWTAFGTANGANSADLTVSDLTINKTYKFKAEISTGDDSEFVTLPIATTYVVNVDNAAPATPSVVVDTANSNTFVNGSAAPNSDYLNSAVVEIGNATDSHSGVATVQYAVKSASTDPATINDWATYNAVTKITLTATEDGVTTNYVYAKVTDAVGNVSYSNELVVTLEKASTVTFVDVNHNVISNDLVAIGEDVTAPNATAAGVTEAYDFDGYYDAEDDTKAIVLNAGDDYTATADDVVFVAKQTIKKFTVTFYDVTTGDTVFDTVANVEYGTVLSTIMPNGTPAAPSDDLVFTGWNQSDATVVTSNLEVRPIFTEKTKETHTITFKNADDSVIGTATVIDGEAWATTLAPTATKTADKTYTYTFQKWINVADESDFTLGTAVTADTTLKAVYTQAYIDYTITLKNWNGDILDTVTAHYGDDFATAIAGVAEPTRPQDESYTYTFSSWNNAPENISADVEVTANFDRADRLYTVRYFDMGADVGTATPLYTEQVTYETLVENKAYNGALVDTAALDYTFVEWQLGSGAKATGGKVTANVDVFAYVTSEAQTYTVTVLDYEGNVKTTAANVEYGTALSTILDGQATDRTAGDAQYVTYTFAGWKVAENGVATATAAPATVSGNVTVIETFTPGDVKQYTISYTYKGETVATKALDYGTALVKDDLIAELNAPAGYFNTKNLTVIDFLTTLPATLTSDITLAVDAIGDVARVTVNYHYKFTGTTTNPVYAEYNTLTPATSKIVIQGQMITTVDVNVPGYATNGWTYKVGSGAEAAFTSTQVTEDMDGQVYDLYIELAPTVAWVEFYDVAGVKIDTKDATYALGASVVFPSDAELTTQNIAHVEDGYFWDGWTLGAAGAGDRVTSKNVGTANIGDTIKFYGNQKNNSVTLKFYDKDGAEIKTVVTTALTNVNLNALANYSVADCTMFWRLDTAGVKGDRITAFTTPEAGETPADVVCEFYAAAKAQVVKVNFKQADGTLIVSHNFAVNDDVLDYTSASVDALVVTTQAAPVLRSWTLSGASADKVNANSTLASFVITADLINNNDVDNSVPTIDFQAVIGLPATLIEGRTDDPIYNPIDADLAMMDALIVFSYISVEKAVDTNNDYTVVRGGVTFTLYEKENGWNMLDAINTLLQLKSITA
ncbi:MAG: InlB B-repeat-containing protein [Clostridiales bacterium]|nr:InlB B-repeat-containing protein [Clostridiales bacterium]